MSRPISQHDAALFGPPHDERESCAAPGCTSEGTERIDTGDILTVYYCADHAPEAQRFAAWANDPSRCEYEGCMNDGSEDGGFCPDHRRTAPA